MMEIIRRRVEARDDARCGSDQSTTILGARQSDSHQPSCARSICFS